MAIFCFLGHNQFLIEEKVKDLNKKKFFLVYNRDFKELFLNLQRITNKNLLNEKNIIILRNIEKLKNNELLIFVSFLKNNYKQNDFIFVFGEEPIDFFDELRKNKIKFEIVNLNTRSGDRVENFISEYLKKHNLKLPPKIIEFIRENYGNDLDLLFHDLEKIVILRDLNHNELTQVLHLKADIFKIQDYLLEKKWPLFVHHFKNFIFKDKSYAKIETLKALSLFFHSLVKIYFLKTNQLNKLKGNKYYLLKLKEKSEKLTIEEIKRLIGAIAKTERKLKKFYIDFKEIPEDISLNYLFLTRESFI